LREKKGRSFERGISTQIGGSRKKNQRKGPDNRNVKKVHETEKKTMKSKFNFVASKMTGSWGKEIQGGKKKTVQEKSLTVNWGEKKIVSEKGRHQKTKKTRAGRIGKKKNTNNDVRGMTNQKQGVGQGGRGGGKKRKGLFVLETNDFITGTLSPLGKKKMHKNKK